MIPEVTWPWAVTRRPGTSAPPIGRDNEEFQLAVLERLENVEKFPHVEGVIFFQNVTLDSSQLGASSVLPYGPGYTISSLAEFQNNPRHLGDMPSQRMYPQWSISRAAHLLLKAAGLLPPPPVPPVRPPDPREHYAGPYPTGEPLTAGELAAAQAARATLAERNLPDVVLAGVGVLLLERQRWPAFRYLDRAQPTIHALGEPPTPKRKTVYRFAGDDRDWYLGSWKPGVMFYLSCWTSADWIDHHEPRLRLRRGATFLEGPA